MTPLNPRILIAYFLGAVAGYTICILLDSLIRKVASVAYAMVYPTTSNKTIKASDWTKEIK